MLLMLVLVAAVPAIPAPKEIFYWDDGDDDWVDHGCYVAVNFRDTPGDHGLGDTDGQPGVVPVVWCKFLDTAWHQIKLYWAEDDDGLPGTLSDELECARSRDDFMWYTHRLTLNTPLDVPGNFWIILRIPELAGMFSDGTDSIWSTSYSTIHLDELDWHLYRFDWAVLVEWEASSAVEPMTWGLIKAAF
jgi:hypothetical protein